MESYNSYSLFDDTQEILSQDFSWITRLSDEDRGELPTRNNSSEESLSPKSAKSSSSPDQLLPGSEASNYGGPWSRTWTNPSSPKTVEDADEQLPSQTVLSEVLNFTNIQLTPIPIWSRSRGVGKRSHTPFIPSNVEYTLQKSPHPQLANEETPFYLIPEKIFNAPVNNQDFRNPVPMCANVIHSSGTTNCAEIQKLDGFPGYRCSFIPTKSGKYSAQLYYNVWKTSNGNSDMTGMELGTMVCEPLEFSVSRNYPKDARNLLSSSTLKLADNGEKYWGITCDNYTGRFYVSDRNSGEVLLVDPHNGQVVSRFGQSGGDRQILFRPTGLVVDSHNKRLIVCDKDNHRICFFSLDGQYISSFGGKGHRHGEFNYPWDVDVAANGNLVIADSKNHRTQLFDGFGNFLKNFSVFETNPFEYKGRFDYPRGVSFDHDGQNIYVSDFTSSRVIRIQISTGLFQNIPIPASLTRPQGIALDEVGNILVCNSRRNVLNIVSNDGHPVAAMNRISSHPLQLPVDVCVLRNDKIALLEINGRIYIF